MKKNSKKLSAILSVILSVLMLLSVCPIMSFAQFAVEYSYPSGTTFISALAFAHTGYWGVVNLNSTKDKLTSAGYSALDWDFNDGCGTNSDWIAGGWKTSTNVADALRDVKFWVSDNSGVPQTYNLTVNGKTVTYYLVGGTYEPNSVTDGGVVDLNSNAGGKYIYCFITRDPNAGPPITDIKFNDQSSVSGYTTCKKLQATSSSAELNEGAGGSSLYMHWTSNSSSVSTTNLQSVYNLAVKMIPNNTNYTSATYRVLETAYNDAKPIVETYNQYGASTTTQAGINSAYTALNNAVKNAETNVYFNASNNGGTTTVNAATAKIGSASQCAMDVSAYTATKGNWTFLGWSTDKNATTGSKTTVNVGFNSTLYAIFGKDVTATFKHIEADGSVNSETASGTIYNTAVQTEVATPSAENVVYNGNELTFLGWRDDANIGIAEYTDKVTLKDGIPYVFRAVYSAPVKLAFDLNGHGTAAPSDITATKYYSADETVVDGAVSFTIPADEPAEIGYVFLGWAENADATKADYAPGAVLTGIKEDITLYAVWLQKSYPVVFKNYDGEILQETEVLHGEMPEYVGTTPVKEGTIDSKWVFDGWDQDFTPVTGPQEYTATFHTETADYLVKFVNADGTVLQESMVDYLSLPEYTGETPELAATAQYSFVFAGWDKAFEPVEGAQIYTAVYDSVLNSYKVYFVNYDGTLLQEEELEYGATPAYKGETPVKEEDVQYIYTFDKWDKAISEVTGETTYTATYKTETKSYRITFKDHNDNELYSALVNYGEIPVYRGKTPEKDAEYPYVFNFVGWEPNLAPVTGEETYVASFVAELDKFIVTFLNEDGKNIVEEKYFIHGELPEFTGVEPTKPGNAQYSYEFVGWTPEFTPVEGNQTYSPVFEQKVNKYTVEFVNYNGDVLQSDVLEYGAMPEYIGEAPERPADENYEYTFIGWNKEFSAVTGKDVYIANYSKQPIRFVVKFLDADGTVLQSKAYNVGELPVYEGEVPAKDYSSGYHYEFAGWNKEINEVTASDVYVAVYSAIAHEFTVSVISAPTCTESGMSAYECDCGYYKEQLAGALGHEYEFVSTEEATYYECVNCGDCVDVELKEPVEEEEEEVPENHCKYCGKYHYKYIFPDLGFISCLISRIFTYFAELLMK